MNAVSKLHKGANVTRQQEPATLTVCESSVTGIPASSKAEAINSAWRMFGVSGGPKYASAVPLAPKASDLPIPIWDNVELYLDIENRPMEMAAMYDYAVKHMVTLHVFAADKWPALDCVRAKYPRATLHVVHSGVESAAGVYLLMYLTQVLERGGSKTYLVVSADGLFYTLQDIIPLEWPSARVIHQRSFDVLAVRS
jgi:hypothetical protein